MAWGCSSCPCAPVCLHVCLCVCAPVCLRVCLCVSTVCLYVCVCLCECPTLCMCVPVSLCPCVHQAGSLEREVQAVDSEFKGVQQSDHSRLAQLMCHTVSAAQPGRHAHQHTETHKHTHTFPLLWRRSVRRGVRAAWVSPTETLSAATTTCVFCAMLCCACSCT